MTRILTRKEIADHYLPLIEMYARFRAEERKQEKLRTKKEHLK